MLQQASTAVEDVTATRVIRGALRDCGFASNYSEQMYRLRYDEFHTRLRWDVTVQDSLGYDRFDDADSVYMLTTGVDDAVCGGWRLRPTTRGYMLRDVFPGLLHGHVAPRDPHVWEISRFAVDTTKSKRADRISLSHSARLLLVDAIRFAIQHGIDRYVLVTSLGLERLLNSSGLRLHRFGPPTRIGRAMAVACWVDIDAHTRRLLLDARQLDSR